MKKFVWALIFAGCIATIAGPAFSATIKVGWDWGIAYTTLDNKTAKHGAEFNLTFTDPSSNFSTYGYCVEASQSIQNKTYTFTSTEVTGNYLRAAWLMDTYSTFTQSGLNFTGTTGTTAISALQAAIWYTLGQNTKANTPKPNTLTGSVYSLYSEMLLALGNVHWTSSLTSHLQNDFQLYTNNNYQNLIVRTAATPIPGAVWLLGSGMVGIAGLRRARAAKLS